MLDTILVVVGFTGATICAVWAMRNNAKIHRLIQQLEKKESELYMLRSARDAAQSALRTAAQRNPDRKPAAKRPAKGSSAPTGQISDDALGAAFIASVTPSTSPYDHRSYGSDSAPNHDSSHSYTSYNDSGSGSYSSDSGGSFGGDAGSSF